MEDKNESILDAKTTLILLATSDSKSAMEVSRECNIPLSTTYRKLEKLLQLNLVKISGIIKEGNKSFLFTSNKRIHNFKNHHRVVSIMNIIIENPGINFREMTKLSGLTNGVIKHYLSHLENNGLIQIKRKNGRMWVFPNDVPLRYTDLIIQLRNDTSYAIVSLLLKQKYAAFQDFAKIIDKSTPLISIRLSKLVELGFVRRMGDFRSIYCLKDRDLVAGILCKLTQNNDEYFHDDDVRYEKKD